LCAAATSASFSAHAARSSSRGPSKSTQAWVRVGTDDDVDARDEDDERRHEDDE